MRLFFLPILFFCQIQFILSQTLKSSDWPNWRGPSYNGASTDSGLLPVDFDQSKRVKWKVELPGPSAATPIIVGDRVFVSSISVLEGSDSPTRGTLLALCFDRKSGKLLMGKTSRKWLSPKWRWV